MMLLPLDVSRRIMYFRYTMNLINLTLCTAQLPCHNRSSSSSHHSSATHPHMHPYFTPRSKESNPEMSTPGWTPDHHGSVTPVTPFKHPTPSSQNEYILETHVSETVLSNQQVSHISETMYSSHHTTYSSHQQSLIKRKTTWHGTHYTHQESHGSETTRSQTHPYTLKSHVLETTPLETHPYVLESLASMTMFARLDHTPITRELEKQTYLVKTLLPRNQELVLDLLDLQSLHRNWLSWKHSAHLFSRSKVAVFAFHVQFCLPLEALLLWILKRTMMRENMRESWR
jgi:hypothetical protein